MSFSGHDVLNACRTLHGNPAGGIRQHPAAGVARGAEAARQWHAALAVPLRNSLGAPGYPATREAKAALLAAGGLLALLQLTPENHRVRLALSHNATRLLIACG